MEEVANGIANCISVAFGARSNKNRLLAMGESKEDTNGVNVVSAPITSRINLHGLNSGNKSIRYSQGSSKGRLASFDF